MSGVTNFGGRRYTEPGVGARVISGVPATTPNPSAGIVLLIDTGSGAGFGAGAGVLGQLASGKQALQKFRDLAELRKKVRGGLHYDLAAYLLTPGGAGTAGASEVQILRACATGAATITIAIGSDTLKVHPLAEGVGANGALSGDTLTRGLAARVVRGSLDANKVQLRFFQGDYAGADEYGIPYNGFAQADSAQLQLAQSPELTNTAALVQWMLTDKTFRSSFAYEPTGSTSSTTVINNTNLLAALGWKLATGGTETYSTEALKKALEVVSEGAHTYVLADRWGADSTTGAASAENGLLVAALEDAPFPRFVVIAGGSTPAEFDAGVSAAVASSYDQRGVIVVDGGCQVDGPSSYGLLARSSLYTAATVLGRKCGMAAQESVTHKPLGRIKGIINDLGPEARARALQAGVLHLKEIAVEGGGTAFAVNQGINTLQKNTELLNPDGQSYDWAEEAINSALINRLQLKAGIRFVGRSKAEATLSDVLTWTQSELQDAKKEGLILRYFDVTAKREADTWFVEFGFESNGPINKLFFTAAKV